MDAIDYSKYDGQVEKPSIDYTKYGGQIENPAEEVQAQVEQSQPKMVNTAIGQMPENFPEEFKKYLFSPETISNVMGQAIAGPGLGIATKGIGKIASPLIRPFINTFKNAKPFQEAAEKAAQEVSNIESTPEKQTVDTIQDKINKFLNVGGVHKVEAAPKLASRAKSIENFWKDSFTKFKEKIKNLGVSMPEQAIKDYDLTTQDIDKAAQEGRLKLLKGGRFKLTSENENSHLKSVMKYAPTSEDTEASKFLDKFHDFKDAIFDLSQDLKNPLIKSEERSQIQEALDQANKVRVAAQEALEKGLGEHVPEYKWLNQGYTTQVHPLRGNPIIKAAKKGKLPNNMVDAFGTNEKGMPLVRELVKQDPELLRNVIGQRYAVKPEEILNPHSGMREYLNEVPELQTLLKEQEEALSKYAARKDISLKEKMRAEQQLKDILKLKKKGANRARNITLGTAGAIGVPGGILGIIRHLENNFGNENIEGQQ